MESKKEKSEKLLVHTCCAVCAAGVVDFLKDKFEIVLFFFNPNIQPKEEYKKRKEAAKKLAEIYSFQFIEGKYEPEKWLEKIKGFEKEKEGGKRCLICFKTRLSKAAEFAKEKNINFFTTTLALSPHKDEKIIKELGEKIAEEAGLEFLVLEKLGVNKKENWQKTRELSKELKFYHQNYCGCVFSKPKNS